MPLDGKCPDCGEGLRPKARKCSCGWTQSTGYSSPSVNAMDLFRCAWEVNGQRCRYVGSVSHSTLGQGPWYCGGHSRSGGAIGQCIVEESQLAPLISYTAQAIVDASRDAYLNRPLPPIPKTPEGVRWGSGAFQHPADIVKQHMREPGEEG